MPFPQSPSAVHLALASALGLFTLNKPQLVVCSNFNPKSKAGVARSGATVYTLADLTHVYAGEVYTPYSNDPGPAALNSSHRCCVRLCKVQLHHAPLRNAWQHAKPHFIHRSGLVGHSKPVRKEVSAPWGTPVWEQPLPAHHTLLKCAEGAATQVSVVFGTTEA